MFLLIVDGAKICYSMTMLVLPCHATLDERCHRVAASVQEEPYVVKQLIRGRKVTFMTGTSSSWKNPGDFGQILATFSPRKTSITKASTWKHHFSLKHNFFVGSLQSPLLKSFMALQHFVLDVTLISYRSPSSRNLPVWQWQRGTLYLFMHYNISNIFG